MVGVNVCGNKPKRLVEAMKIIKVMRRRVHERPLSDCVIIICFVISCESHDWKDNNRLLIRRLDLIKKILGNIMMRITIGRPMSVGAAKEENRFSFI